MLFFDKTYITEIKKLLYFITTITIGLSVGYNNADPNVYLLPSRHVFLISVVYNVH